MLSPKRVKFRKMFKGRMTGIAHRGSEVSFGTFGLQAMEPGWVSNRQIEAARVALTRHIKRGGKVWIRIFPDKPITKKPAETRMGKGKGSPEGWVAVVKPGRMMFELEGVTREVAETAIYPESGTGSALALAYVALGLGEAGEVQGKIKKILRDDNGVLTKEKRDAIGKELGDLLWYVARTASEISMLLDDVAEINIHKLKDRAERGVLGGSGDNR